MLQLTREPQNPLLGAAVQLCVALRGIILFSWATQDTRPLQKSRPDFRVSLDEIAELLNVSRRVFEDWKIPPLKVVSENYARYASILFQL